MKNCNAKKLIKILFACLGFLIVPTFYAADTTYFFEQRAKLEKRIDNVLHPILHGSAESNGDFWSDLKKAGNRLQRQDWDGAKETVKNSESICQKGRAIVGSVVHKYFGKEAERALFEGSGRESSGTMSLNALNLAEDEIRRKYPDWDQVKDCPEGVHKCLKLGNHSKALLTAINIFFENIDAYEKRTGKNYFPPEETDRIFIFLRDLVSRICEENILHAAAHKGESAPDDHQLQPYRKIINYLVALPTEFHDISEHAKRNKKKIDKLLEFLPPDEKRAVYDYMKALRGRAKDPEYGHTRGDTSINLLFSGGTATGKTFVGKELLKYLGFTPIEINFNELRRGQEVSFNELEDLVDESEISGIEKNMLRLAPGKNKGIASLNQVVFVDELDEDRNYTLSELKEQFDQFKKMYFPSLDLTVPGYLNCIFTTNNQSLFKTDATLERFREIIFPKMTSVRKFIILCKFFFKKLRGYPHLEEEKGKDYFKEQVKKVVLVNRRNNLRLLMENIDSVIYFHDRNEDEEDYLVPIEDRGNEPETFDAFLQRTFGQNRHNDSEDEDSESDSDFDVDDIQLDQSDDEEPANPIVESDDEELANNENAIAEGEQVAAEADNGQGDDDQGNEQNAPANAVPVLPAENDRQVNYQAEDLRQLAKVDLLHAAYNSDRTLASSASAIAYSVGIDWRTLPLNSDQDTIYHISAVHATADFCYMLMEYSGGKEPLIRKNDIGKNFCDYIKESPCKEKRALWTSLPVSEVCNVM